MSIPVLLALIATLFTWGVTALGVVMVEPVAGVPGAYPVLLIKPLLPYALSFAAGAMIFVVAEELVPESQSGNESDLSTIGALLGFSIMMFLDAALG